MIIKLEPLMEAHGQLERLRSELDEAVDDVSHVFRRLGPLTGMDGVRQELRRIQTGVERERDYAGRQAGTLQRAAEWYSMCERRIEAEYEDAAVRFPRRESGVVELGFIHEFLY